MLEIPRTIRDITADDVPNTMSILERILAKKNAKITEGYRFLPNENNTESKFNFFAEININNSRLWDLFMSLCGELPEIAALLFGFYDNEINYGKYVDIDLIVSMLKKYKREVVEDCHLELGLIYSTESTLIEVFIKEAKYIQFWGNDGASFRNIMLSFNLREIPDIEFIDEYPKVVFPLKTLIENVYESHEIIADLKDKFIE